MSKLEEYQQKYQQREKISDEIEAAKELLSTLDTELMQLYPQTVEERIPEFRNKLFLITNSPISRPVNSTKYDYLPDYYFIDDDVFLMLINGTILNLGKISILDFKQSQQALQYRSELFDALCSLVTNDFARLGSDLFAKEVPIESLLTEQYENYRTLAKIKMKEIKGEISSLYLSCIKETAEYTMCGNPVENLPHSIVSTIEEFKLLENPTSICEKCLERFRDAVTEF